MRIITLLSNNGSGEHAQTRQSLRRLHTQSMDVDKDPDQNVDVALLDMSAWAFKGGFWAIVINHRTS